MHAFFVASLAISVGLTAYGFNRHTSSSNLVILLSFFLAAILALSLFLVLVLSPLACVEFWNGRS